MLIWAELSWALGCLIGYVSALSKAPQKWLGYSTFAYFEESVLNSIDGVDYVCEDGGDATSTGEMIPRSVTLAVSGPAATTAQ